MLDTYVHSKKNLGEALKKLEAVARSQQARVAAQALGAKLADDIFTLVVVGQFKRGKTTFINALLGADVLPTAMIPLTSVITILRYGDTIGATVYMEDGSQKSISIEDIQYYATEKHNPKNEKGVARVEVVYPSPYLKNGVQIVDTPGVASVHEHNTATTYQYLPHADAAIFLVSVDPPITRAELLFLQDIKKVVPRVFFVQNKIDVVSPADRQEVLEFTAGVIREEGGFDDVAIYPLSAKTKEGFSVFEESLERFLTEEKGTVLLRSAANKIRDIISQELVLAELEKASLKTPLAELERKLADFKTFLLQIHQESLDSERLLTHEVKELQKDVLESDLERFKKEGTRILVAGIDELALAHARVSNKKFIDLLNDFLARRVREIFGDWQAAEEKKLKQHLEKIVGRFTDRINDIFAKLFASSSEFFGIPRREIRPRQTLPSNITFWFQTEDETDMLSITLDVIKRILPRVITHKIIWRESKERAEMLVDRHCGRLRYDFSRRMEKLVTDYKTIFDDAVTQTQEDILRAVEAGMAAQQKTGSEVEKQERALADLIATLNTLRADVERV